ncbi:MAG TPA: hypothetical protein VFG86_03275 [Chloroflexota bacterium]|nr:hypothetical protein [Chloroflexota bacterium]
MQQIEQSNWATVARETFEYNMIPWAGRRYAQWLRAWSRPHPGDPSGLTQVPAQMFALFQKRVPQQRLSRKEAEELGYPGVPGERELDEVRRELHEALGRCDWEHAHDLDMKLRELQERVAEMRMTALRPATARS